MRNFKILISALTIPTLLGLAAAAVAKPYGHVHSHNHQVQTHQVQTKSNYSAPIGYLKPGASVSYRHNLKPSLEVGESETFELILDEAYSAGWLDIDLSAEGAISVYAPSNQLRLDMSDGNSHTIDVTVSANGNGRHYINVSAVTDTGEPRIFGIAVQVGGPIAAKPSPNMAVMPNGENLIIMDAEEVVK